MFNARFVTRTVVVTGAIAAGLVFLIGTPLVTAIFSSVAIGIIAGLLPYVVSDGRYSNGTGRARAQKVAIAITLGSGLVGVYGLDLDRVAAASLSILVLGIGYACFLLGAASVIEDEDDPARVPSPPTSSAR